MDIERQHYDKEQIDRMFTKTFDYTDEIALNVEQKIPEKALEVTIMKVNNIEELRKTEGKYEGQVIELLGYYESGEYSLKYKWTTTKGIDDGGYVINSRNGSWVAMFDTYLIDVVYFGITNKKENHLDKWLKLNTYCVENNKTIYLSIDVTLITYTSLNIYTANIKGNNTKLYLDGQFSFRTDNNLNVNITDFEVYVKNNYTTLTGTNGSTYLFYNTTLTNYKSRKVKYNNLKCYVEAPLYDGSNRLNGFIRDGGHIDSQYSNIITDNVSNVIVISGVTQNINTKIFNIYGTNFKTLIWTSGDKQHCYNLEGINTPEQARNWQNKTNAPTSYNGCDVILASGNGIVLDNIRAINPIERCCYIQCNDVKATNLYSLNGDGFKFVGVDKLNICKNIYVSNIIAEWDNTFNAMYNHTLFQVYWCDNYNISDVTVINNNTISTPLIVLISFKRRSKNVRINNITMKGERGLAGTAVRFEEVDEEYQNMICHENIEFENINVIRSSGRTTSTFNHYPTPPSFTFIKNFSIKNCSVFYQKISEQGDDFLYRWDCVDGFTAEGNYQNTRGHWTGGISNTAPSSNSNNIYIKEDKLKAINIGELIKNMNQGFVFKDGSYMRYELTDGSFLKAIFRGDKLSTIEIEANTEAAITYPINDATFIYEVETKFGYCKAQIVNKVSSVIYGTVPTPLISYADGQTNLLLRGDQATDGYSFKGKLFL